MSIAEHRSNEADAAGIGILASGISGCVMRDFIQPLWVNSLHTQPSDAFAIEPFAPMGAGDLSLQPIAASLLSHPPVPVLAIQFIVANTWQNFFGQSYGKTRAETYLTTSNYHFFEDIWAEENKLSLSM